MSGFPVTSYGPARMRRDMHGVFFFVLAQYSRKSVAASNRFLIVRAYKKLIFFVFEKVTLIIKGNDLFTETPVSPGIHHH